jgi:hypothetical protein
VNFPSSKSKQDKKKKFSQSLLDKTITYFFTFFFIVDFLIFHKKREMQSADDFTPSTTEPVFGSGLISQTKNQTSTNDNEKVIPPSETIVNGQNDATVNKLTSSENITNGTNETNDENSGATDSSAVHVNGEQEKPTVEINDEVQPAENSVSATEQPIVPPTESEPVDTVNEVSSTAVDIVPPAPVVEEPTTTTTEVVNDNVPEVPVATESEPTEVKSKVKSKKKQF